MDLILTSSCVQAAKAATIERSKTAVNKILKRLFDIYSSLPACVYYKYACADINHNYRQYHYISTILPLSMIFRGFVFMQNLPPLPDFGLFCREHRLLCRYINLNCHCIKLYAFSLFRLENRLKLFFLKCRLHCGRYKRRIRNETVFLNRRRVLPKRNEIIVSGV